MHSESDCTVRDGKFVEPCDALEKAIDNVTPGFSNVKGVARWNLIDMKERKASRSFIGLKSKQYPKGMLFNFCPFCGSKIDAPFNSDDDGGEDAQ